MALREIIASFGYDIDHAELHKGEAGINHMIESIGSLGKHIGEAFAAYEIKEFVDKTIEGALQLHHAAIIAGTTAEKLQSLQFAAEASEVPVEALSMGLMRLQRATFATGAGAAGAGAAFKALGLDQKELAKMDSTEAFVEVAEAISKVQNPAEQTAIAMKVFGRGGAQLLPILKEGSEGISKLRGEVAELGGGYSGEYLEASKKYKEETVRLHMAWRSFAVMVTDKLVPVMTTVVDKVTSVVRHITELRSEVDLGRVGLAVFVSAGIAGLTTLGSILMGFAAKMALPLLGWIALGLAVEDVLTLFQGGESLSGKLLDKIFGAGAAETFVADVTAMGATWDGFISGLANMAGTAAGDMLLSITGRLENLGTWLAYVLKLISSAPVRWAIGALGGDTSKFEQRMKDTRDQGYAENNAGIDEAKNVNNANYRAEFDRIRDAATTAHIVSGREAQLNQSKPAEGGLQLGPGTPSMVSSGVPSYITQSQNFVDKSTTVVNTMPGTTDGQAKAIGAAVAKARRQTSEYRGSINALEDAVE